jgi:hypothetical protein
MCRLRREWSDACLLPRRSEEWFDTDVWIPAAIRAVFGHWPMRLVDEVPGSQDRLAIRALRGPGDNGILTTCEVYCVFQVYTLATSRKQKGRTGKVRPRKRKTAKPPITAASVLRR